MKKILLAVLAAAALACAFASVRWRSSQWEDVFVMPFRDGEKEASVSLKIGQSVKSFAEDVRDAGIVTDSGNLLYWLAKNGTDRKLRAGTYSLKSGASWQVAERLKTAVPSYSQATIIPGALPQAPLSIGTEQQQADAISDDGNFPEGMRKLLPKEPEFRAAFLIPETYSLVEASPSELVKQASASWYARFGKKIDSADAACRAAVIASLLQREAQLDSEYPVIAGVIENRLAKGMALQIDASVVYAWYLKHGEKLKRVLYRHLEVDSPYNTYRNAGLPPMPICVPSAAAWEAAVSPQKNGYYYYVADGSGGHRFAKDKKTHDKNVRDYRKKTVSR